jgi:hypothetical protein
MKPMSALDVDLMWQRACVKTMLAVSPRTDPDDARRLAAAACMVGRFRALPAELAAGELLVHPTVRPSMKAESAKRAVPAA